MTRSPAATPALHVRFGDFELDEANALLLRDGAATPLAPTPFGVLCALLRRPGALLTKHALLDEVWGHRFVSDSVLKTAISDLRSVLGDDVRRPRYIQTVARRGYRFVMDTTGPPAAGQPPAGEPQWTEPAATGDSATAAFVGRAAELTRLRQAWDRVMRGRPAVVWIAGEPGIGKSTLIERFVTGMGDAACIRGQCVEHYGGGEPYLPVLEALGQLCRADSSAVRLLHDVAPTWLLQLPWLSTAEQRESLRRELVGVGPERMLREMVEFLRRYSVAQPLLLVTEDLHWADRATIQLLDYFARGRADTRLMWLSSFRLTEVVVSNPPLNAVRHELRLHGLSEEIVLDPFSEIEVAAYITKRLPSLAGDEEFVRAVHARTDGVPLFVASVTSDLIKQAGRNKPTEDTPPGSVLPVPEDLTAIIDHYVHKLDEGQRALLSAAAVCGVDFSPGTLARVLGREEARVTEACDRLVREQRWIVGPKDREPGGSRDRPYSFRHALYREVLYDGTAPSTRAELHRKVGDALEEERAAGLPLSAAELAMHFERGHAAMAALRYYAESAETALAHLNPGECMDLAERALSLLDRTPASADRSSIEITLAALQGVSAFQTLGAGAEAKVALERAASLLADDSIHPKRGLVLHGLGFLLSLRGQFEDALAIADRAEALSSGTGDRFLLLAAGTVRGHVCMHQGRPDAARVALESALDAAGGAETTYESDFIVDPRVMLLGMLSLPLAQLGLIEQAQQRLRQAYDRARGLGQPVALLVVLWYEALLRVRLSDVDRVAELADEMQKLVDEFALAQGRAAGRWFRGWAEARRGNALDGFERIRRAHEDNVALGMRAGASENLGYAAEALLLHGDWRGAQEQLDEALEVVSTSGERIYLPQLLLTEAGIAKARGQPEAAEASIRRAVDEARAQGAGWLELQALIELCDAGAATGEDRRGLAALVERLDEARATDAAIRAGRLVAKHGGPAQEGRSDGTATVP